MQDESRNQKDEKQDESRNRKSQKNVLSKENYWRGINADRDLPLDKAPKRYFMKRSLMEQFLHQKPEE